MTGSLLASIVHHSSTGLSPSLSSSNLSIFRVGEAAIFIASIPCAEAAFAYGISIPSQKLYANWPVSSRVLGTLLAAAITYLADTYKNRGAAQERGDLPLQFFRGVKNR
jgi:hypothetical protein